MAHSSNLLVTLYSANPFAQSIPLNGYKYASELHKIANIKVIAHKRDKERISQSDIADVTYYAGSRRLANTMRSMGSFFFKGRWNLISLFDFWEYLYFDLDCLRLAKKLHKEHNFNAIMRMTPTTPQWPSLIYKTGIPVISGPHNGGMSWPKAFKHLSRKGGTTEFFRRFGDTGHFLYRDLSKYSRILCANEQTAEVFGKDLQDKIVYISENGIDRVYPIAENSGDVSKLLFVGRLIPCRSLDILLRAINRLPVDVKLKIVGDGPQKGNFEELSKSLEISDRVEFVGQVKHSEVESFFREAGVFVFPSVRDSGGIALLEAMAHGLPSIVAKWGGPYQYIGEEYGISLPVTSMQELEDGLVSAIESIRKNPNYGRELGINAREKVKNEFLWESKAKAFLKIAEDTINESAINELIQHHLSFF